MNAKTVLPWVLAPLILTVSLISHGRHHEQHPQPKINEFFLEHYDEGLLKKVLEERCPTPQFNENVLNLSKKHVDDRCIEILSANLIQLQRKIENQSALAEDYQEQYATLKSEITATRLNLSDNDISDEGVSYLYQALLKNNFITEVDLRNNALISIEGKIWLNMLQKFNSNIKVLF